MKHDVMNWIKSCKTCAAKKAPPPTRENLHSLPQPQIPFDRIGIDFMGPFPSTDNGHRYILVITDYCTRWTEAFATKDMKAETVAKILIEEIICRYSAPRQILSDQGRNFLSQVVKEVCNYFRINKINTSAYHPATNGLCERFNGTLCKMLSVYVNDEQTNWDIYLPIVLFAYRVSEQKSAKESPFKLLFGREARLPADIDKWTTNQSFLEKIDQVWKEAKINIEKMQETSAKIYNSKYINEPAQIKIGDQIRLHNPVTKPGLKTKLRKDLWKGPFTVVNTNNLGNVQLNMNNKLVWHHKNRVKLAEDKRNKYISRYGRETKLINYKE